MFGQSTRSRFRVAPGQHEEGALTTAIEHYTTQAPSVAFMGVALASVAAASYLYLNGRKQDALYVGQWVAPFLIMGLYNKLVRLEGTD